MIRKAGTDKIQRLKQRIEMEVRFNFLTMNVGTQWRSKCESELLGDLTVVVVFYRQLTTTLAPETY